MSWVDWLNTKMLQRGVVRDVGKIKLPNPLGSASFHLRELKPSAETGERRYLLTVTRIALLRYQAQVITLTHSQLDTLSALLGDGLSGLQAPDRRSVVSPASFS